MCEPWPRTMYSGSHPTLRNARTGEFTPPGINFSARFCNLRDCSVLRVIVPPTLRSFGYDGHRSEVDGRGRPSLHRNLLRINIAAAFGTTAAQPITFICDAGHTNFWGQGFNSRVFSPHQMW